MILKFLVSTMIALSFSMALAKPKPSARQPASPEGNVQYGGSEEYDACGGYGVVLATTVAIAYDKTGKMIFEKIEAGTMVTYCESKEEFIGVVFGKPGLDCKTSSPIKDRKEYKGPCKSGWIKPGFFELLAG